MSTDQLQCLHARVYIVFACNNTLMTVLPRPLLLSPQVKLWNTSSGFCFVTFSEHTSAVTGVCFSASGKVVLSASLDGTVRAFDLHRCVGVSVGVCRVRVVWCGVDVRIYSCHFQVSKLPDFCLPPSCPVLLFDP